jgi:predicted nuclease of predicted toxin-antitoxin system
VKFLIDAQLPARLAGLLSAAGHDAVHTSQLPDGNRTTDAALAAMADGEDRVVVTKDRDFRDSHLLRRAPRRLLVVTTGNISNRDLLALFTDNLEILVAALGGARFVELCSTGLVIHDDKIWGCSPRARIACLSSSPIRTQPRRPWPRRPAFLAAGVGTRTG